MRLRNRLRQMDEKELIDFAEHWARVVSDFLRKLPKAYYVVKKGEKSSDSVRVVLSFGDADAIEIIRFEDGVIARRVAEDAT